MDVLILKTGYSEFLDNPQNSSKPSLGDILRTTPLLHIYKDDKVTWVTDKNAFPLLEQNPYIDRLLPLDFKNAMHLLDEDFDMIINLEKNSDICKFSDKINAWNKRGFRLDKRTNTIEAYDKALEVLSVSSDTKTKKENKKTAQELLFELVDKKWNGEEYILGYQPKKIGDYDIGLNLNVGGKWPTKKWPMEKWDELEDILIKDRYKVTRQDKQTNNTLTNLNDYMNWINSSRLIISNDSLGMHIAIALKKKVLGLFGPNPSQEVDFYNRGKAILPNPLPPCLPCSQEACTWKKHCMEDIEVDRVYKEIKEIMNYENK